MKIYVCADLHLGRNNIHHLRKQFSSAAAHDSIVINRWRATVKSEDLVYILGDLAFNRKGLNKLLQLPGKKQVILGNHDLPVSTLIKHFASVRAMKEKTINGVDVIMTHIPIKLSEFDRYAFNIHGHVHSHTIQDTRHINVSLEAIDYRPVLLETLMRKHLNRTYKKV